jgi:AhpD family alkylhydroperoxidase
MTAQALWCALQSSEIGKKHQESYVPCNEKVTLDKTTKELLMLALACVSRCPHCTEEHIKSAFEVGASKAEVVEVILTTLFLSGQVHDKHCFE